MRKSLTVLATMAVAFITIPVALAESVHSKRGPTCVDNGLTATCTGTLSGLGNFDIKVTISTTGTGTTNCTNPGGSSKVPGQNPGLTVAGVGSVIIPGGSVKNGNAPYTVSTTPPPDPTPQQAGCPGANWTATFTDVTFQGISATGTLTLTVFQCEGGTYNSSQQCVDAAGNVLFGGDGLLKLTETVTK